MSYDSAGHHHHFGYGRVNALAALEAVGGGGSPGVGPSISGPANSSPSTPPTFSVNLGNHRLYAVEFASQRELLDPANDSQRTSSNHFGSWTAGLISTPTYQPPGDVWGSLATGPSVYYLAHFADDNAWSNYAVSSSVADAARIEIVIRRRWWAAVIDRW